MSSKKNTVLVIILIVAVIGGVYLASVRPRQQRAQCNKKALYAAAFDFKVEGGGTVPVEKDPYKNGYSQKEYEYGYQMCLRSKGL